MCLSNTMPPIMANSNDAKIARKNILIPVKRSCQKKYGSSNIFFFFSEVMPISKLVKYHGQKVEYQQNNLITSDIYMKYQSSSTHYSNVISKNKQVKL